MTPWRSDSEYKNFPRIIDIPGDFSGPFVVLFDFFARRQNGVFSSEPGISPEPDRDSRLVPQGRLLFVFILNFPQLSVFPVAFPLKLSPDNSPPGKPWRTWINGLAFGRFET